MWTMVWPVVIVVASNTAYHVCAKSLPDHANTFASLTVTYGVAAVLSLALFFLTGSHASLPSEFGKLNWSSYALGISIVGLEFGFLCLYRASWKLSIGNLVCGIALACVLMVVGILVYREAVSFKQGLGAAVCLVGLVLISG